MYCLSVAEVVPSCVHATPAGCGAGQLRSDRDVRPHSDPHHHHYHYYQHYSGSLRRTLIRPKDRATTTQTVPKRTGLRRPITWPFVDAMSSVDELPLLIQVSSQSITETSPNDHAARLHFKVTSSLRDGRARALGRTSARSRALGCTSARSGWMSARS